MAATLPTGPNYVMKRFPNIGSSVPNHGELRVFMYLHLIISTCFLLLVQIVPNSKEPNVAYILIQEIN